MYAHYQQFTQILIHILEEFVDKSEDKCGKRSLIPKNQQDFLGEILSTMC